MSFSGLDFGQGESQGEGKAGRSRPLFGLLVLAGTAVGLVFFWNYLKPDSVPEQQDPTFADTIFANAAVIAAARVVLLSIAVVLLFGSLYVAASSVVRMRRRQWLRRAGPFESHLDEAQEELGELDPLFGLYLEALEENEALAGHLTERDQQLEELTGHYEAAIELMQEEGVREDLWTTRC